MFLPVNPIFRLPGAMIQHIDGPLPCVANPHCHVVHATQEEIVDFVHKERATVGYIRE